MWIVNFVAAFFAALLAAMGVGGGGLLVIYLLLVLGTEQLKAQGINLLFFICASLVSLPFHAKAGRIKWNVTAIFAPAGAFGAYIGCKLALTNDPKILRTVFGYLLIFAGGFTLLKMLIPMLVSFRKRISGLCDKKSKGAERK